MSVCATCHEHGIRDYSQHDCPGLGDIQLTRQLGRGLRVDTAPARARMALTVLADHGHGLAMQDADCINIADQVLYQVVGYDPESAALVLELVEDWRIGSAPDEVEDQLRRTRIELEHWQAVIVPGLRGERDRVRAAFREVLAAFATATSQASGATMGYQAPPIHPDDMDRWRAALDPKAPEVPPPGFVPFVPEHITRRETTDDPTAVEPYRNDRNQDRWVFRCWGTATCEGWLSLDHPSQESAERARDRHVAEEHSTSDPAATEPATCTATLTDSILTDGAPSRCIAPAGHYDETRQPEYPESGESDPRGWHHTEPGGDGVRTVWADWADGATPHEGAAVSGYPTPDMRKKMQDVKPGTPPSGPAGASSANGKPTPATEESVS